MKRILLALVIFLYPQIASALTIATGPSDGSYFGIRAGHQKRCREGRY